MNQTPEHHYQYYQTTNSELVKNLEKALFGEVGCRRSTSQRTIEIVKMLEHVFDHMQQQREVDSAKGAVVLAVFLLAVLFAGDCLIHGSPEAEEYQNFCWSW
jgi:hypothetical protein